MRLIDADALIDKYGDWYTEEGTEEGYIGTIKGVVDSMPTIEPQQWIPVSEKLPEEDGEYLVANLTIKGKPYVYGIDTFANDLYQVDKYDFSDKKGKRGWVYFHYEYGYLEDKTVVAWMPLPDAYMGE